MELGHSDKHSPIARERKSQGKNLRVFCLETLKNFILNDKFYQEMTTIRAFFLQIRALFSNFQNRAGETSSPPLTSSYAPVNLMTVFTDLRTSKEIKKFQSNNFAIVPKKI